MFSVSKILIWRSTCWLIYVHFDFPFKNMTPCINSSLHPLSGVRRHKVERIILLPYPRERASVAISVITARLQMIALAL